VLTKADRAVQRRLDELVRDGTERGLQVAAYLDGELVVDAWAGLADEASGRPVDSGTLFTMFSATKGVTATAVHMLAERGKRGITLRHVLSHRAGLPRLPEGTTPELMADWEAMTAAIARLEPEWAPGSRTVYHGMTFGWVLGEVLRRVDGRAVRQFVHDEIGRPLGAPDLHIGVTEADEGRVATLYEPAGQATSLPAAVWNSSSMRRAIVPAAGGLFSARSLARLYAALAAGGALDGARLLSPERVALARERQTPPAEAAACGMVFGLGYRLGATIYPAENPMRGLSMRESVFGHTGAGGSIGFADPERRFAVAVAKNMLRQPVEGRTFPTVALLDEVRRALGVEG
jgi:CubicO group peptidase (beta-lactamase class C family)